MTIPCATVTKTDYENFSAECPYQICKFWNIFNRRSDLKNTALITYQEVQCKKCSCFFAINCDEASEKWEYLLYGCYDLLENKKYMSCVLNAAQALEAFFHLAIKKKLLYDPFEKKILAKEEFNKLSEDLYERLEKTTLPGLKGMFMELYCKQINLSTKEEVSIAIRRLKKRKKTMSDLFGSVENIWKLRCNVGHKEAYRPTKDEADVCLKQAREILMRLKKDYKIRTPVSFCKIR